MADPDAIYDVEVNTETLAGVAEGLRDLLGLDRHADYFQGGAEGPRETIAYSDAAMPVAVQFSERLRTIHIVTGQVIAMVEQRSAQLREAVAQAVEMFGTVDAHTAEALEAVWSNLESEQPTAD